MSHYRLLADIFGKDAHRQVDLGRSQKKFKEFYDLFESFRAVKDRCFHRISSI